MGSESYVRSGCPGEQVDHNPPHPVAGRAETLLREAQPSLGDVENGEVIEAADQQSVDQRQGATADIDDTVGSVRADRVQHRQRQGGVGLKPTAGGVPGCVSIVPVRGRSCINPRGLIPQPGVVQRSPATPETASGPVSNPDDLAAW